MVQGSEDPALAAWEVRSARTCSVGVQKRTHLQHRGSETHTHAEQGFGSAHTCAVQGLRSAHTCGAGAQKCTHVRCRGSEIHTHVVQGLRSAHTCGAGGTSAAAQEKRKRRSSSVRRVSASASRPTVPSNTSCFLSCSLRMRSSMVPAKACPTKICL